MNILRWIMRILFGLNLLLPSVGGLGFIPAPTADLYTPQAWPFISALLESGYMFPLIGITCLIGLLLIIMNRMALAAVWVAPLTVNVMLFHIFLQHDPLVSTIFGVILFVCNVYFLWTERDKYRQLWS